MELTRKTEYAIAMLTELALTPGAQPVQSRQIAERRRLPENLVPQITAMLSKKGWIEGTRGVGGGIRLITDPATISILDVIELVEGPIYLNHCLKSGACSGRQGCSLRQVWSQAQDALLEVFRHATIAQLAAQEPRE